MHELREEGIVLKSSPLGTSARIIGIRYDPTPSWIQ